MAKPKTLKDASPRFGIGEWFGNSLIEMTPDQRREFADEVLKKKKDRKPQNCPFQSTEEKKVNCSKDGGVCSLRRYNHVAHPLNGRATGQPSVDPEDEQNILGSLRITCPYRFHENDTILKWVSEIILGDDTPAAVSEVGFLEAGATTDNDAGEDVGRIDMVLVSNKTVEGAPMAWCALEIQAVYFSGDAMKGEFESYTEENLDWVIFPAGKRRPDYRSSGPKRLMPQLQIKVPTLRRWGKKMAVVVDRAFFDSIGQMDEVTDISNADIAWFVVRIEEEVGKPHGRLVRDFCRLTTLERSVEGLTGGKPVSLTEFENRISNKIISATKNLEKSSVQKTPKSKPTNKKIKT